MSTTASRMPKPRSTTSARTTSMFTVRSVGCARRLTSAAEKSALTSVAFPSPASPTTSTVSLAPFRDTRRWRWFGRLLSPMPFIIWAWINQKVVFSDQIQTYSDLYSSANMQPPHTIDAGVDYAAERDIIRTWAAKSNQKTCVRLSDLPTDLCARVEGNAKRCTASNIGLLLVI